MKPWSIPNLLFAVNLHLTHGKLRCGRDDLYLSNVTEPRTCHYDLDLAVPIPCPTLQDFISEVHASSLTAPSTMSNSGNGSTLSTPASIGGALGGKQPFIQMQQDFCRYAYLKIILYLQVIYVFIPEYGM